MSWRAGLAALLALSTLLVAPAQPARAHARLVQAVPPGDALLGTAPARIDLLFDDELDGDKSRLRVYDASGSRVDRNDLQVVARRMTIGVRNLAPGSYRVSWLSVAADDKGEIRGAYAFQIGPAAAGQPQLSVSPDQSDVGQTFTVAGAGFTPNTLLVVAIGDEQRGLAAPRTDGQGRFAVQTLIPEYLPNGRQVVQAVDLENRMANAALQVNRGGWPPLGAQLTTEFSGPNEITVEIRLVNRSGWDLRRLNVRASIPNGTRVLREGLEGPEGVDAEVANGEVVWKNAHAAPHQIVGPFSYVLDTHGLAPGVSVEPSALVTFLHTADPQFRGELTVSSR